MNNSRYRSFLVYVLILVVVGALTYAIFYNGTTEEITLSELRDDINAGEVKAIKVSEDNKLTVTYKNEDVKTAKINATADNIPQVLEDHDVNAEQLNQIDFEYAKSGGWLNVFSLLATFLPLLLIIGFIIFMLRQAQGSNNQAMQFGRSRARMFTSDQPTVTFDDVAGAEEAKEELKEVVEFLKEPEKFIQLGARIPKGVLLVGAPGTGKTLLAKAVAGEAGVPFFSISGSEFVEMFVGVGASRVRDLFEQAKRHSPCIVFVDEIDAVGRHRGSGLGGSHDEREQTLNQILVEMDGFDTDTNVIVVAATNRPDILDPALLRPGRFDRRVTLDRPDMKGRKAILKVHSRGKPMANDVDVDILARTTPGLVGADIMNLVNEAAIVAARKNRKTISMRDFEEALERIVMGLERKSRVITDKERRTIAYHEAGHAVVIHLLSRAEQVRKVTIIPRGMAAGVTWSMPTEDSLLRSQDEYLDSIAGLLGGRAAEEVAVGTITSGAANDLERVTQIARSMVTRWGMSDRLGLRVFGKKEEMIFLGREISEERDYSDHIAEVIDEEVYAIVQEQYQRAITTLNRHRDKLDELADRLLEVESIDREEFLRLMGDEPDKRENFPTPKNEAPPAHSRPLPGDSNEAPSLGTAPSPA